MQWDLIPNLVPGRAAMPSGVVAPGPATQGFPADFANVAPPPSQVVNPDAPLLVSQNPLQQFLGDIAIPAATTQVIDIHSLMGSQCVGFVLIPIITIPGTNVNVSINGGGFRTVPGTMVIDESVIDTLTVQTFVGSAAILQLNGA